MEKFVTDIVLGTLLLVAIGLASVILHYFHIWIEYLALPPLILVIIGYVEKFVFVLDISCYILFAVLQAWSLAVNLIGAGHGSDGT